MLDLQKDRFAWVGPDRIDAEAMNQPSVHFWQDAWRRLKKNKLAMISMVFLILMSFMAIFGESFVAHHPNDLDLLATSLPPSSEHWFGTDDLGRDLWARVWYGARISLFIGVMAALLDMGIGVIYGGISGYFGGRTDNVMMRIVEVLYGIPFLILTLLLVVVMGPGIWSIILAMALTGWMPMARLVRGQVLQLKEQEFVLAARAMGQSSWKIISRHLIPNTIGPILVNLTLTIPSAIFTEAFLAYVGLGVPLPAASWGTLAEEGTRQFMYYPWQLAFPAVMISLTMLSFNLFGDGLRDALDPKMRR